MPNSAETVFEARELTKFYGNAHGIEFVSLGVEPAEMFGLLGPNGAGKTTLIRSALRLLSANLGEVRRYCQLNDMNQKWSAFAPPPGTSSCTHDVLPNLKRPGTQNPIVDRLHQVTAK